MDEYPAGEYVLIADVHPSKDGTFFFGDRVYLDAEQAGRMLGSGSVVEPDSEDGELVLSGVDKRTAKEQIMAKRQQPHIVHRRSDNLQASPQPNPHEEPAVRPEDDPEELERMYAQGPDWHRIRGRQSSKAPERGPKPDDAA